MTKKHKRIIFIGVIIVLLSFAILVSKLFFSSTVEKEHIPKILVDQFDNNLQENSSDFFESTTTRNSKGIIQILSVKNKSSNELVKQRTINQYHFTVLGELYPMISPDGEKIAEIYKAPGTPHDTNQKVVIEDTSGHQIVISNYLHKGPNQGTDIYNSAWSPNSEKLLYNVTHESCSELDSDPCGTSDKDTLGSLGFYLVDLDEEAVYLLLPDPAGYMIEFITWLDNETILFIKGSVLYEYNTTESTWYLSDALGKRGESHPWFEYIDRYNESHIYMETDRSGPINDTRMEDSKELLKLFNGKREITIMTTEFGEIASVNFSEDGKYVNFIKKDRYTQQTTKKYQYIIDTGELVEL